MAEDAIVDSVICLECPEDECERRIIERAKTSGRSDDNLVIRPPPLFYSCISSFSISAG